MDINVLEDKKTRFVFELKGEDHTICNSLREELWNDDDVKVAAYNISHPLVGVPKFIIETKKGDARSAVKNAIKRLKSKNAKYLKEAKKL